MRGVVATQNSSQLYFEDILMKTEVTKLPNQT